MCYDTALTKTQTEVQEFFEKDFDEADRYLPYYHQSGFTYPTVQIIKMDSPYLIHAATWGFVPQFGLSDIPAFRKKYNTLNIRYESLFKGISKEAGLHNRCLILADGFFEPHKMAGLSIPYFCYIPSESFPDGRHLFAFGGIYSEPEKEHGLLTCSLLTMDANPYFAKIHNGKKRQPFVIDEKLYSTWLNPYLKKEEVLELVAGGFTSKTFKAHPVSQNLYNRSIHTDHPKILEEVPPPGLLF